MLSNLHKLEGIIDADKKSGTVLIVEDDHISSLLLHEVLKAHVATLLIATNGQEAIDTCHKHPEIDMVLMDIRMPVMDGLTASRKIKTFRKNLPIIAITACVQPEFKNRNIDGACDHCISKPINKNKLLALVKKFTFQNLAVF